MYTQAQIAVWVGLADAEKAHQARVARNNRLVVQTRYKAGHAAHVAEQAVLTVRSAAILEAYYGGFTDADYSSKATAARLGLMRAYRKENTFTG